MFTTEADFYSAFLHELNQPVTTLRNLLELTTYRENNDWPAVVDAAVASVDCMVELLVLMGELSQFERAATPAESFELTEPLREAIDDLGVTARAEGRNLIAEEIASGVRIAGMAAMFRSALFRVLGDALHHIQEGEAIRVSLRRAISAEHANVGGLAKAAILEIVYPGPVFADNELESLLALVRTGRARRGGITQRVFRLALLLRLIVLPGAELQWQVTETGGPSRLSITYRLA